MAFRLLTVCAACTALAAIQVAAQISRPELDLRPPAAETRHLTLSVSSSSATAAPGARLLLFVDVVPKPRMHVYAPEQQEYIPISLTITPDRSLRAQPPRYPAADKFFFAPLNETYRVYSKPFRITQPIAVAKTITGDTLTINGAVRYQACDDAVCYVPEAVPVNWKVMVKPVHR